MNCWIALRLLFVLPVFVLPAIFIASYLASGLLLVVLAIIWPYLLGGIVALAALAILAAKVA